MNYYLILKLLGNVLKYEGFFMLLPLMTALIYGENPLHLVIPIILLLSLGKALSSLKPKDNKFSDKEGMVTVSLSWLALSFFGALPFYLSGHFRSFPDCFFEAVSGFTTTGSTILQNVEILPQNILFWRSFTHWIGGMGVLVLMLAVLPAMSPSSVILLKAESTGPAPSKIVPKIRETAKLMYKIYLFMTVTLIILLKISGLSLFDSLIYTFGSVGTGGFSNKNASVGAFNNVWAEGIITVFTFLCGVNFSLYFYLTQKDFKSFFKDEELRFYSVFVIVSMLIITINTKLFGVYLSIPEAFRHASFQVSTIVSSTGYATWNFDTWPALSKMILLTLMFTGCCAGSTGGGIKMIRILVLLKALKVELSKVINPRVVKVVKINGKKIDESIISKILLFFFIYFTILASAVFLLSLENKDLFSSITAAVTALSNIGPGFGIVGPAGNFSSFTSFSKLVLSFCMLAGRLEFFPVLILFVPSIWKKSILR